MRRRLTSPMLVATLAVALLAVPAGAQLIDTLAVSAVVLEGCLVIPVPLLFGVYDPLAASALEMDTLITVECAVDVDVGIDGCSSGDPTAREMVNALDATQTLSYSLSCTDDGGPCAGNWGNVPATDTQLHTGSLLPGIYNVNGVVPAGQNPDDGLYLDTCSVGLTAAS